MRHAFKTGYASKIHAPILAFLTTGDAKIAGAKFVHQIGGEYMRVAERDVPASCRDLVTETRHECLVQIAVSIGLERDQICARDSRKHGVLGRNCIVKPECSLVAVILDGDRKSTRLNSSH